MGWFTAQTRPFGVAAGFPFIFNPFFNTSGILAK
jgi:hypothetical protein